MFSTVSPTLISDICTGDTRSNFLIIYYFAIPVGRQVLCYTHYCNFNSSDEI